MQVTGFFVFWVLEFGWLLGIEPRYLWATSLHSNIYLGTLNNLTDGQACPIPTAHHTFLTNVHTSDFEANSSKLFNMHI